MSDAKRNAKSSTQAVKVEAKEWKPGHVVLTGESALSELDPSRRHAGEPADESVYKVCKVAKTAKFYRVAFHESFVVGFMRGVSAPTFFAASTLELPEIKSVHIRDFSKGQHVYETDADAIGADWMRVGSSMKTAMDAYGRQQEPAAKGRTKRDARGRRLASKAG